MKTFTIDGITFNKNPIIPINSNGDWFEWRIKFLECNLIKPNIKTINKLPADLIGRILNKYIKYIEKKYNMNVRKKTEQIQPSYKEVGNDPNWTLSEWKKFIDDLLKKYPSHYILRTDAGHNSVSLELFSSDGSTP